MVAGPGVGVTVGTRGGRAGIEQGDRWQEKASVRCWGRGGAGLPSRAAGVGAPSGPEPWQGGQQAEQEPEAQQRGAGPQPLARRADVAQEALAAVGAHGRHAEVDAGAGADWGAALVQGVAEVHQVPCRGHRAVRAGRAGPGGAGGHSLGEAGLTDAGRSGHGHTVVVGVRADGRLQAVEVAVLIRAREAHQAVGCRTRGHLSQGPGTFRGDPSAAPPLPAPPHFPIICRC